MSIHKIAVIGANGFIAIHLCKSLQKKPGIQLYRFGRSPQPADQNGSYATIDLLNQVTTRSQIGTMDVVYYLASETYPITSWQNPMMEVDKNLVPFISFMSAISGTSVKKVVYVSSAGTIYGTTSGKVDERYDKAPFSPYGIMKLAMENLLNYYRVKEQIAFDIYRISNVYGEGQNTTKGLGIINTFIEKIIRKEPLHVFGDGSVTRNYIYVKDVAQLMLYSLENIQTSDIFNLSSNDTCSINDLIAILKQKSDRSFEVEYTQGRQSDNSFIDLDNSKIISKNPEFVFTPLENGIEATFQHIISNVSF
jgi:UDP-glucose 4-epimerase